MSAELERVQDATEIVENDWLEPAISQWNAGAANGLRAALEQMESAFFVKEKGGVEGMNMLSAGAIRASRSKVYAFAKTYRILVEAYGNRLSGRLESSPIDPWQLVESAHNGEIRGDVDGAIARTEKLNLSTRNLKSERTGGGGQNVEMVTEILTPCCGEWIPLSKVETREVPADSLVPVGRVHPSGVETGERK